MAREVPLLMPKMSMTMESGEVLSWLINEGDDVAAGDPIAEVQTDKVDMEVESPVTGTLARIVAGPGQVVDVGSPMGFLTSDDEDLMAGLFDPAPSTAPTDTAPTDTATSTAPTNGTATDSAADSPVPDALPPSPDASADGGPAAGSTTEATSEKAREETPQETPDPTPVSRRGPRPAVPQARRRAAQLRVSLDDVQATGRDGIITVADVEAAASSATAPAATSANGTAAPAPAAAAAAHTPPPAQTAPSLSAQAAAPRPAPAAAASSADPAFADALAPRRRAIRAAVARTMSASTTVPQFTIFAELDLERANQLRNGVGWTTLLMRALARVLRKYPEINAGWDDAANAPKPPSASVGVALAIDSAVGLLAPVIRDPDQLSVADQDALVRATVDRARTGKLSAADIQGGTTTLSNLGGFGVPSFTSLLTPPQATALSVGAISQRPFVVGGGLAVRLGTTVGLTVDHRPVDGADGARLLADLRALFAQPDELLR